jgi:hypothetical protein
MSNNKTLGGVPCPQYSDVYVDQCQRCHKYIVAINDVRVHEGCQCLTPQLNPGMCHKVETARIVDALGVKFDEVKS